MSVKTTLLLLLSILLLVTIGLYIFSTIEEQEVFSESIYIEPIVIPKKVVEEDNDSEILNKLKLATEEVFKNSELSKEVEADEVLTVLQQFEKEREAKFQRELEIERELSRKKEFEEQREIEIKEEIARARAARERRAFMRKRKRLAKEKRLKEKQELAKRVEDEKKRKIAKVKELKKKEREKERKIAKAKELKKIEKKSKLTMKKKPKPKIKKRKIVPFHSPLRITSLGIQQDLHTLSKEEREKFKHLEVVSVSKSFALERKLDIKSPIEYRGTKSEVKFEELPFVETLGVVAVSKPFVKD